MTIREDFEKMDNKLRDELMNIKSWAAGEFQGFDFERIPEEEKEKIVGEVAKVVLKGDTIYSPCTGKIDKIDKDDNSFEIEMVNGLGLRLKTCKKIADFKSEDVDILVKEGEEVKAGQPLVRFAKELEGKSKLFITTPIVMDKNSTDGMPLTFAHADGTVNVGDPILKVNPDAKIEK